MSPRWVGIITQFDDTIGSDLEFAFRNPIIGGAPQEKEADFATQAASCTCADAETASAGGRAFKAPASVVLPNQSPWRSLAWWHSHPAVRWFAQSFGLYSRLFLPCVHQADRKPPPRQPALLGRQLQRILAIQLRLPH